ncbi:hypothetical protein CF319_g6112 [Tilletia indica]|nr:hypothetical protein CF319_g6112 [Tilletia indica]
MYATSMATGLPTSLSVLKDITSETVQESSKDVATLSQQLGRVRNYPPMSIRLSTPFYPPALSVGSRASPATTVWSAYLWRLFLDFCEEALVTTSAAISTERRASQRVQEAYRRHLEAPGEAFSDDRERAWDTHIAGAPRDASDDAAHLITSNHCKIPCPASLKHYSVRHRLWFMSRQEGVDLVAAAGQYDAVRSDPDQAGIDFDQAEYFRRRQEIAANRTADQTLKTVVSPPLIQVVINRLLSKSYGAAVHDCSCLACGLRFLGDINTSHRCHPAAEEIPVRTLKTEDDGSPNSDNYTDRDMLFLLSDVAERFGLESILTAGSEGNQLRYVDVGTVLETSMIWDALVPYIHQRYPAQLAELETSYLIEPRPFLITDTAAQVPNSVEYDALFWAVTKTF